MHPGIGPSAAGTNEKTTAQLSARGRLLAGAQVTRAIICSRRGRYTPLMEVTARSVHGVHGDQYLPDTLDTSSQRVTIVPPAASPLLELLLPAKINDTHQHLDILQSAHSRAMKVLTTIVKIIESCTVEYRHTRSGSCRLLGLWECPSIRRCR